MAALKADGGVVASEEVALGPGEHRAVSLETRLADGGSHRFEIGDFPAWDFSTYRNVPGAVWLYRDRIALTAGGARNAFDQYAAVYFNDVRGDFDVVGKMLSQTPLTGNYSAIGLIIGNEMSDVRSGGVTTHYACRNTAATRSGTGTPTATDWSTTAATAATICCPSGSSSRSGAKRSAPTAALTGRRGGKTGSPTRWFCETRTSRRCRTSAFSERPGATAGSWCESSSPTCN